MAAMMCRFSKKGAPSTLKGIVVPENEEETMERNSNGKYK
jgi:hypothetical protein